MLELELLFQYYIIYFINFDWLRIYI